MGISSPLSLYNRRKAGSKDLMGNCPTRREKMERQKVDVTVTWELDLVPGTNHTPESGKEMIQGILSRSIPHYNPVVSDPKPWVKVQDKD
jgi:hypothetical protein